MTQSESTIKAANLVIDPPLPQQKWVCLSFISPEDKIKERLVFTANKYLHHQINQNVASNAMSMCTEFVAAKQKAFEEAIAKNPELAVQLARISDSIEINATEFSHRCLRNFGVSADDAVSHFDNYVVEHQAELDQEFEARTDEATSVRGVKIRGTFAQRKEAEDRCRYLRENVEPNVHIYVAPVGYWLPWDPNPDSVQRQEHMVNELNELMGKYNDNVQQRNAYFRQREKEMKDKAAEENQERKERNALLASGNAHREADIAHDPEIVRKRLRGKVSHT
ncbi:MAG: DUF5832 domain-containing protein [Sulfobacillus sp.]